jgi:hypothetical protein
MPCVASRAEISAVASAVARIAGPRLLALSAERAEEPSKRVALSRMCRRRREPADIDAKFAPSIHPLTTF